MLAVVVPRSQHDAPRVQESATYPPTTGESAMKLYYHPISTTSRPIMAGLQLSAARSHTATIGLPLSEAAKPSTTSFTDFQLLSAFMRSSHFLTFG